jgi:3'(2'), 5'-bisphosphate nucleotidase
MTKVDAALTMLEDLAVEAGQIILDIRADGTSARLKGDGSPVTDADQAAEGHITAGLRRRYPRIPIIAEESACVGGISSLSTDRFFLVDPLDGTKEFIKGRADFTVNISLIQNGVPCLGVVVAPARNELFSGGYGSAYRCRISADGCIRERKKIATRAVSFTGLTAVMSASHANPETSALLDRIEVNQKLSIGSSLKFCLVASGMADVYPRLGRTMQWDTAAGDAVLRNAGGSTLRLDGSPLSYGVAGGDGVDGFANPHFVACGGDAAVWGMVLGLSDPRRTPVLHAQ